MATAYDIIIRPIITERAMSGAADKKYVFEVAKDAGKIEIKKAVEEIGRQCEKVIDKAVHYLPHKDLNEFLQERIKSSLADRTKLGQACG